MAAIFATSRGVPQREDESAWAELDRRCGAGDGGENEVVLVSMARESAVPTIREALAIGAGAAVHVVDDALLGADTGLTAEALAAAVQRTGFDLSSPATSRPTVPAVCCQR